MSDNFVDNFENDHNKLNDDSNFHISVDNDFLDDTTNGSLPLKNGVKLPTSTNDWDIANKSFHSNISTSEISENDTDETLKHLIETVYNYFQGNFGLADSTKEGERVFNERKNLKTKEIHPFYHSASYREC